MNGKVLDIKAEVERKMAMAENGMILLKDRSGWDLSQLPEPYNIWNKTGSAKKLNAYIITTRFRINPKKARILSTYKMGLISRRAFVYCAILGPNVDCKCLALL